MAIRVFEFPLTGTFTDTSTLSGDHAPDGDPVHWVGGHYFARANNETRRVKEDLLTMDIDQGVAKVAVEAPDDFLDALEADFAGKTPEDVAASFGRSHTRRQPAERPAQVPTRWNETHPGHRESRVVRLRLHA